MKAVREKEVKLRDIGFVKQVGFKPGVKEKELWMYRVVNQKKKKCWVKKFVRRKWRTIIRLTKRQRELISETR